MADAGPDQRVHLGERAWLDASGSSDPDGDPLTYDWSLIAAPAGSGAALSDAAGLSPVFVPDLAGTYQFDLTVSDGLLDSEPDSVMVTTENVSPVAVTGANQTVKVGDIVFLDGADSFDIDGDALDFSWTLSLRPAASMALLDQSNSVDPSFVVDQPGHYEATLIVSDGQLISDPAFVEIDTINSRPHADAGDDQSVYVGDPLVLDGSRSYDPDVDSLSFQWSLLHGPVNAAAELFDSDEQMATFIPAVPGEYVAQLIVADHVLDSEPDTVVIEVEDPPNRPPHITSTAVTRAFDGTVYIYDLHAQDPDGGTLTYFLVDGPRGMVIDPSSGRLHWIPSRAHIGMHDVEVAVQDRLGLRATQRLRLTVDPSPNRAPRITSYPVAATYLGEQYLYQAHAVDPDGGPLSFSLDAGPEEMTVDQASGVVRWPVTEPGAHRVELTATDLQGASDHQSFLLTVSDQELPEPPEPDSTSSAPAQSARFSERMRFLFEGPGAVQTGVAAGAIEVHRAAVVRGYVHGVDGAPLSGVRVAVKDAPELGQTLTRSDGGYDLMVNGGGSPIVEFSKPGWLSVQRPVEVAWEEIAVAPDVVLTRLDSVATEITLGDQALAVQVARATRVKDADGERQATLLFPAGLNAELLLDDGSRQPIEMLTVRATEYTVGPSGPAAMPGTLPAASGYTYAVELSADEAIAVDAAQVSFDRPVSLYVENFLGFPVGTVVPVGWYDHKRAVWVPAPDGLVIGILGVDVQGRAQLDLDGSGMAASAQRLAAFGISDGERAQLAGLYEAGTSLWRSMHDHFTPWDCNWPYVVDSDDPRRPSRAPSIEGEALEAEPRFCGSNIGAIRGSVSESIPITGTGLELIFDSTRSNAFRNGRRIQIPLTGSKLPDGLREVEVRIDIGGQVLTRRASPLASQDLVLPWDGRDAYGRPLRQSATGGVQVCYQYGLRRVAPSVAAGILGSFGSGADFGGSRLGEALPMTADRTGLTTRLCSRWEISLSGREKAADYADLGGWSLSALHALDPNAGRFVRGDGREDLGASIRPVFQPVVRSADHAEPSVAAPVSAEAEGDPTGHSAMPLSTAFTISPDGTVLLARDGGLIQYQPGDTSGTLLDASIGLAEIVAVSPGFRSEEGWYALAREANSAGTRLYWLAADGSRSIVAGTGESGCIGDSSAAQHAVFSDPSAMVVSEDGNLYIADAGCHRIYRLRTDGMVVRHAGTGVDAQSGDNRGALEADLGRPTALALAPSGDLYVGTAVGIVRRIEPSGFTTTVAGRAVNGFAGDGGPGTDALLGEVRGLAVADDGTLYIDDSAENARVRALAPDDQIRTIAGNGQAMPARAGAQAAVSPIGQLAGLEIGPDRRLYIAERYGNVYRLAPPGQPLPLESQVLVPDGMLVHAFDAEGRHLESLDGVTGASLRAFDYDGDGRLRAIREPFGRITSITRDVAGKVTITAPNGQVTELALDDSGRLSSVRLPEELTYSLEAAQDGSLRTFTRPGGGATAFRYDASGRLVSDTNPAGGGWTIQRRQTGPQTDALLVSAAGRQHRVMHRRATGPLATSIIERTFPDGRVAQARIQPDGAVERRSPDGSVVQMRFQGDPRWGHAARYPSLVRFQTPAGRSLTTETEVTAELADPANPFTLARLTTKTVTNGMTARSVFDAATNSETVTSAAGRQITTSYDRWLRPLRVEVPGLAPVRYRYDDGSAGFGRLIEVVQGNGEQSRTWTYGYDANGNTDVITDPVGRTTILTNDRIGRPTSAELPGGRLLAFRFDGAGNLQAITPPGRPEHVFAVDALGREIRYDPPALDDDTGGIDREFNLDGQIVRTAHDLGAEMLIDYDRELDPAADLTEDNRPDGRLWRIRGPEGSIEVDYDINGRIASLTSPEGNTITYAYDGPLVLSETASGLLDVALTFDYDDTLRIAAEALILDAAGRDGAEQGRFDTVGDPEYGIFRIPRAYDDDGLLTKAGELMLSYAPHHGLLTETGLGALRTRHGYNAFGEPETLTADWAGETLFVTRMLRDPLGRIVQIEESVAFPTTGGEGSALSGSLETRTLSYAYDEAGRLASFSLNGQVAETYGYDANGNRTTVNASAYAVYDDQDRLVESVPNHSRTLPETTIGYVSDAANRRIARKVDGVITHLWVYRDRLNPIAELHPDGTLRSLFVYADRSNVPAYLVRVDPSTAQQRVYRFVTDHLGSPRLLVDIESGTIAQRLDYDPWGRVILDTNPGFQPFGFAGGLYDTATGLVRFGARDYDPHLGRWMAKDPIRFEGGDTNIYQYVGADPVNFYDPDGLEVRLGGSSAFGIGTHVYIYSTITGQARGRDGSSGWQRSDGVPDLHMSFPYISVPLPPGISESEYMRCVGGYFGWNRGGYFFWSDDCHTQAEEAMRYCGSAAPPEWPTGRIDVDDKIGSSWQNLGAAWRRFMIQFITPNVWLNGLR